MIGCIDRLSINRPCYAHQKVCKVYSLTGRPRKFLGFQKIVCYLEGEPSMLLFSKPVAEVFLDLSDMIGQPISCVSF